MLDCTPNFFYTQYMFTLSAASKATKDILKWGGLIVALIVVISLIGRILLSAKNIFFPSPPPKPTVAFGKLTSQNFPANVTDQKFNYSLNTLTGQLPNLPSQAKVYKILPVQPDLLALSKFDSQVTKIGFISGHTALSNNVFEWKNDSNQSNLDKRLRFNLATYGFTILSSYTSNQAVLSAKNLPSEKDAKAMAQALLENMKTLPEDIDFTKTITNLYSINNGVLNKAASISNAQIIEVNFVQNDLDNIPIFYEKPLSSNIRVLVGGGDNGGQIVGANYAYQKISNDFSTYPLKTTEQAFNDLKQDKGYLASYTGHSSNVVITNVFLAYYVGNQPQDFVMPIFIFQGNDNFYGYVPATADEWINM